MAESNRIWHEGIVKEVSPQTIEVIINSHSACSACHAKGACGMSDVKQKIVVAERPVFEIKSGDKVIVYAAMNNAVYSVMLAYVAPSVLILTAIFFLEKSGNSELMAAIISIVLLAFYFFILYRFRNKISQKIRFTVEKSNQGNY